MRDRYDDMISSELGNKLNDIHASEDLILKTLAAIEKECGEDLSEPKTVKPTTLTAIDQSYVTGYIHKSSRKVLHIKVIALAAAVAVTASVAVILAVNLMKNDNRRPDDQPVSVEIDTVSDVAVTSGAEGSSRAVPLGFTSPESNYFNARSISNRPMPPMSSMAIAGKVADY
ncbi:MAG: hypothetical protein J5685_09085 [Clostridiales bacterium]|nr:hypothetical protein [Clostridiales bacterium]